MEFYKTACDLNEPQGCLLAGAQYQKTNPKKAKFYFKKSCKLGHEWACEKVKEF